LAGVPLNTIDEAKNRIESAKAKTGLTVTASIIQKTYEIGKKVTKDFISTLKIKFSDSVPNSMTIG
jgi:copper oxidase (laccase) domain-containing protein